MSCARPLASVRGIKNHHMAALDFLRSGGSVTNERVQEILGATAIREMAKAGLVIKRNPANIGGPSPLFQAAWLDCDVVASEASGIPVLFT
jgi:hypothetical protein